jgi:hypothetical protein
MYPYKMYQSVLEMKPIKDQHLANIQRVLSCQEEISLEANYSELVSKFPEMADEEFAPSFHDSILEKLFSTLDLIIQNGGEDTIEHINKPFFKRKVVIKAATHPKTQVTRFKSLFHDGCIVLEIKSFTEGEENTIWSDLSEHIMVGEVPLQVQLNISHFTPILNQHLANLQSLLRMDGEPILLDIDFEDLRISLEGVSSEANFAEIFYDLYMYNLVNNIKRILKVRPELRGTFRKSLSHSRRITIAHNTSPGLVWPKYVYHRTYFASDETLCIEFREDKYCLSKVYEIGIDLLDLVVEVQEA